MPRSLDYAIQVEEADTGIINDGWDNFLLNWESNELRDYAKILKRVRATGCTAVVEELILWVGGNSKKASAEMARNLAISENPEVRAHLEALWKRYSDASEAEAPLEKTRTMFPPKKRRFPITEREHYEFFGVEDPATKCREATCQRGTVRFSVLCRVHHFEDVFRKPCPWTD